MGKSRVSLALVSLISTKEPNLDKVVIYFPTEVLRKTDLATYDLLRILLNGVNPKTPKPLPFLF
jgi:hypothetical protein